MNGTELYVYQTVTVKSKGAPFIRLYCYDEQNKIAAVNCYNFHSYLYLSLTRDVDMNVLRSVLTDYGYKTVECKIVHKYPFLKWNGEYQVNEKGEREYINKTIPFIFISFLSLEKRQQFIGAFQTAKDKKKDGTAYYYPQFKHRNKRVYIQLPDGEFEMKVHELFASPETQLMTVRDLPWVGWINVKGLEKVHTSNRSTRLESVDNEYQISNVKSLSRSIHVKRPPVMISASWDIETNSDNPNIFPTGDLPDQYITCIGLVIHEMHGKVLKKYAISINTPTVTKVFDKKYDIIFNNTVIPGTDPDDIEREVIWCNNENMVIIQFFQKIIEHKCTILLGYNLMGFDIEYVFKRSKDILRKLSAICMNINTVMFEVTKISLAKHIIKRDVNGRKIGGPKTIKMEGRLTLDLLPFVHAQQFKTSDEKLNSMSKQYLKDEQKDTMTAKGMFLANAMSNQVKVKKHKLDDYILSAEMNDNVDHKRIKLCEEEIDKLNTYACGAMGLVNKYCVQDCDLPHLLADVWKVMMVITTAANLMNVSFESAYTSGKMTHVHATTYKICYMHNTVLEYNRVDPITVEGKYSGATVLTPIKGLYYCVISLDFKSLYPSIMASYNLSMNYYVEWNDTSVHWDDTYNFDWHEHINCEHDLGKVKTKIKDVRCGHYQFRFLKRAHKPAINTIMVHTAGNERKIANDKKAEVEAQIATCTDLKLLDDLLYEKEAYDKQQNQLKVGMNSQYGVSGAKNGMMQTLAVAMVITYIGRCNIEKTRDIVNSVTLHDILNHPKVTVPESFRYLFDLDQHMPIMKCIYGDTDSVQPELYVKELKLYTSQVFEVVKYRYITVGWRIERILMNPTNTPEGNIITIENKQYVVNADGTPIFDIALGYYVLINDSTGCPIYTISKFKVDAFVKMVEIYMNNSGFYLPGMYLADEQKCQKTAIYYSAKMYEGYPLLSDQAARKRARDALETEYQAKRIKSYDEQDIDHKLEELGNEGKMFIRGTFLARRTGCLFIREVLEDVNQLVSHFASREFIREFIDNVVHMLMTRRICDIEEKGQVTKAFFSMSQKLGANYKGTLPAHAVLAERMTNRGDPAVPHERIHYEYTYSHIFEYAKVSKSIYIEKPEYIKQFNLKRAYLRYVKDLIGPLNNILDVRHNDKILSIDSITFVRNSKCIYNTFTKLPDCKANGPICVYHSKQSYRQEFVKSKLIVYDDEADTDDNECVTSITKIHDIKILSPSTVMIIKMKSIPFASALYKLHYTFRKCLHELTSSVMGPILIKDSTIFTQTRIWLLIEHKPKYIKCLSELLQRKC